ncbi:unnamed protein product [Protopolystoma xenopodis]|uniref:Uncharacterized protein n=1 Tax=Protopolystoma xenopodis TaxID=117903 RepID=A0A3S5FD54_9PLAT|nr:unnamed protein product [Protopolystoma xenopodis]
MSRDRTLSGDSGFSCHCAGLSFSGGSGITDFNSVLPPCSSPVSCLRASGCFPASRLVPGAQLARVTIGDSHIGRSDERSTAFRNRTVEEPDVAVSLFDLSQGIMAAAVRPAESESSGASVAATSSPCLVGQLNSMLLTNSTFSAYSSPLAAAGLCNSPIAADGSGDQENRCSTTIATAPTSYSSFCHICNQHFANTPDFHSCTILPLLSPASAVQQLQQSSTATTANQPLYCGVRHQRTISESSDADGDLEMWLTGAPGGLVASGAGVGPSGQLGFTLHQLMHESHKPSCADHPTNLDQEIGQSILGQIHHELARLHEAGRFLNDRRNGWSRAGLGQDVPLFGDKVLPPAGPASATGASVCIPPEAHETSILAEIPEYDRDEEAKLLAQNDHGIDWQAVVFHEKHAAQLGCLEAMIIMAHYYLGLPTQLFCDCPIKVSMYALL